jgi:hypothetical protein
LPEIGNRTVEVPGARRVPPDQIRSEYWFMIEFQLDTASGVATYLQLVQQVHQALQLGPLEPGDKLPTAQQIVAQLAINPNTVLKAYRDLEREGLVRARPGQAPLLPGHCRAPTLPPRPSSSVR